MVMSTSICFQGTNTSFDSLEKKTSLEMDSRIGPSLQRQQSRRQTTQLTFLDVSRRLTKRKLYHQKW